MASSLTQTDVARLLAQPSPAARAEVAGKLAREIDSPVLGEAELQIAHDILRILAQDVELAVRRALSASLRTARRLPHDVAMRLAHDVEAVALPILTDCPVLTEADLVELIANSSSHKQAAIAGRADVSEAVADALTRQGSEEAVAALLANEGARIADASLGTAIDRFADSERVKTRMVHRANLPATVAERLVAMVSENLQAYLVRHHELPASLASDIVLQGRERATLAYSLGTSERELERLVRQMHRRQRLTPFLVLRAICVGDTAFFEMAMAVMAGVPVANARILIHDAGPNGLASLYEQTGMPPRLLPAVRVALNVVHGTEFDGGERDRERYRSRVITRILTQFEDLPAEDVDYLLDRLSDVLTVTAS
ncbi:MAG TPA: DUF2336 domain-containing protein [Acetobacteraceae bacterium]|jgi:uncharacterized protein (DUF2336 family)